MAEIINLSDPTRDVTDTLEGVKKEAQRLQAHGALIVLVHGDDQVQLCTSHEFTYASVSGYMMTALVALAMEVARGE
jgi:hypothetical protein